MYMSIIPSLIRQREVGGLPKVQDQCDLHSDFQGSWCFSVKLFLRKSKIMKGVLYIP